MRLTLARLLLACGFVLMALCGLHPASAAPSDQEVREAMDSVMANERFQTELPADVEPAQSDVSVGESWKLDLPDGLLGFARLLMWLLVGVGAILLLIFIVNEVSSFRRRSRVASGVGLDAVPDAAGLAAGGNGLRLSLEEADRLAGEGRFADALHMLLLDCIAQLRRLRFESLIAPSLTSRELAGRLNLPEQSANALVAIVSAVELSHFGGRMPGEDDYRQCRDNYLQIARDSTGTAS